MTYETKPNTAVVYVENGIFNKAGVENLQAQGKPIIKVKMNVDGKDLEIPLWFKMVWDEATNQSTNQFFVTSSGSKMLKGKVELPFVPTKRVEVTQERPQGDIGKDEFDDDIPF
tara:strand:+ start:333 stop:674 length:342 start_codon:yes stop_codon:yes gene_type:complete